MLLVTLDRHGFEALFVAALDPQRAGLFDRWRYAAGCVGATRYIVASFDQPRLGGALFRKLFFSTNTGAVGVGGTPDNQAGGQLALADGGHFILPPGTVCAEVAYSPGSRCGCRVRLRKDIARSSRP